MSFQVEDTKVAPDADYSDPFGEYEQQKNEEQMREMQEKYDKLLERLKNDHPK